MKMDSYRIGVVISQAGLNPQQLTVARQNLGAIAKVLEPGGDGLVLVVPSIHHEGPAGAAEAERLVAKLADLPGLRVEVVENVCSVPACLSLFEAGGGPVDEVWCFPAERQSASTGSRAWSIYDAARQLPAQAARKYKLIPPWVQPAVREAKTAKQKPLKGY